MKEDKSNSSEFSELRRRAEKAVGGESANLDELSPEDTRRLIHDLQVHQIELEMQNEELRRIQAELAESRDKYSDLYDFAPVGYLTLSEKGLIVEANLTCASLLGIERSSLIGKPLSGFIARDDEDIFYIYRRNVLAEKTRQTCELRMVRRDGGQFYAQLESIAMRGADNRFGRCRIVISDVSERKRIEEELQKVQKLESVGILAGGIAHDFNNLLTGIIGNIFLARMYTDPDKISERLAEAEKVCMRTKGLTQQLLTFSRGGEPVKKISSIAVLLDDTVSLALSGSNVRYSSSIPDDLWLVKVDPGQVSQVISNILINATQAMPGGGVVEVWAENVTLEGQAVSPLRNGEYVRLDIQDHGGGISAEHLQKIFDPYFTTKQRGSGLGLTVCYSIIEKHDGRISVESQVGIGTIFHIYLPASPGAVLQQAEAEDKLSTGMGNILIMDDEHVVRELAATTLGNIGYTVSITADGGEAVELYRKARESGHSFDVVILDLTVPGGMGGKEAIHKLIEIDSEVKAIVSSGYSNDPIMSNFTEYGFSGVIAKPYNARELTTVLSKVMTEQTHIE
ncbi:ATP-binding protein [Candidatus Poribacteria bacterium]